MKKQKTPALASMAASNNEIRGVHGGAHSIAINIKNSVRLFGMTRTLANPTCGNDNAVKFLTTAVAAGTYNTTNPVEGP